MQPGNQHLKLVHCDDNPYELERFAKALGTPLPGFSISLHSVSSAKEFQEYVAEHPEIDLVVLDIDLGNAEQSGMTLINCCQKYLPGAVIVMQSGLNDASTIIECLTKGADDFISKDCGNDEIGLRLVHAYRMGRLKRGLNSSAPSEAACLDPNRQVTISGNTMKQVAQRVPQILNSAITAVHVNGESGTGKEIVADLFAASLGKGVPMVRINCAAFAPSLLYGELFGHVRGAYTGANQDKAGLVEIADGGWVFLDEVSNLSVEAQGALLRVLENKEVRRLGSNATRKVDVRILSATNESLKGLVAEGRFRKDLWQRLCETELYLPPLRERPGEIAALVSHFCKTMTGGPYQLSMPAMEILCQASWSEGNVRELRNCLRAMTEYHSNNLLTPLSIPAKVYEDLQQDSDAENHEAAEPNGGSAKIPSDGSEIEIMLYLPASGAPIDFDSLVDQLLLKVTKHLYETEGKQKLRRMSEKINVSRSTLSGRLRSLIAKEFVTFDELASMVGISESAATNKTKGEK